MLQSQSVNLLLSPKSPVFLSVVDRFLLRDPCLKVLEELSEILSAGTSGLWDSWHQEE